MFKAMMIELTTSLIININLRLIGDFLLTLTLMIVAKLTIKSNCFPYNLPLQALRKY
jgi:hypothetical protein